MNLCNFIVLEANMHYLLTGKVFCDAISICNGCSSSRWTETWRCKCLDWRCHAVLIQSLLKGTSELCRISRRCSHCKYTFQLLALIISNEVHHFFFLLCVRLCVLFLFWFVCLFYFCVLYLFFVNCGVVSKGGFWHILKIALIFR